MKKVFGVILAFLLLPSAANAAKCENSPALLGSAIAYFDDAKIVAESKNIHSQLVMRKVLRRAGRGALKVNSAVVKCGASSLSSGLVDVMAFDDEVLQRLLGLRMYPHNGDLSTEVALQMVDTLTMHAIKETYSSSDVDMLLDINSAIALLEHVEMTLLN